MPFGKNNNITKKLKFKNTGDENYEKNGIRIDVGSGKSIICK